MSQLAPPRYALPLQDVLEPESDDEFAAALAAAEAEAAAAADSAPASVPPAHSHAHKHGGAGASKGKAPTSTSSLLNKKSATNAFSHSHVTGAGDDDDLEAGISSSSAVGGHIGHDHGYDAADALTDDDDAASAATTALPAYDDDDDEDGYGAGTDAEPAAAVAASLHPSAKRALRSKKNSHRDNDDDDDEEEEEGDDDDDKKAMSGAKSGCADGDNCSSQSCREAADMISAIEAVKAKVAKQNQEVDAHVARLQAEQTLTGAIFRDDAAGLQRLLINGVSPDQFDASGEHSALHHASYRGSIPMVNLLLSAGARVDVRNIRGETPLMWACKTDALTVALLLLEKGADPVARDAAGLQPIHHAAYCGQTLLMDVVMLRGARVNVRDSKRKTALHWAAYGGHARACEWLLSNGADAWVADDVGCLPVHWAMGQGHGEVMEVLTSAENDHSDDGNGGVLVRTLDARNKEGLTPEEFCAARSNKEDLYLYRQKYTRAIEKAVIVRKTYWMQEELLCGIAGRLAGLVKHCRGLLVMWTFVLIVVGSIILFTKTLPFAIVHHPLLLLLVVACLIAGCLSWVRVIIGEPGGLVPWSAPTPGVPSYARLHALYLAVMGAPRARVLAALAVDEEARRKHGDLLGMEYVPANSLGSPSPASNYGPDSHSEAALLGPNSAIPTRSEVSTAAASLPRNTPYQLVGGPVYGAGTAAGYALAVAGEGRGAGVVGARAAALGGTGGGTGDDDDRMMRGLPPVESCAGQCALEHVPGGPNDDGSAKARCLAVWAGVGVWGYSFVVRTVDGLCKFMGILPSNGISSGMGGGGRYSGLSSSPLATDEDDDDEEASIGMSSTAVKTSLISGSTSAASVAAASAAAAAAAAAADDTVTFNAVLIALGMTSPVSSNIGMELSTSQLCPTCRIVRPLRSKHCSQCHRCVARFDHHCPFLGTDIGAGNYHAFFLFCAALTLLVVFFPLLFALDIANKIDPTTGARQGLFRAIFANPILSAWVLHYPLYGILTAALAVQHMGQIRDNLTTNESINRTRYPYLTLGGSFVNPFSLGFFQNLRTIFGFSSPEPTALTLADALHIRRHRTSVTTGSIAGTPPESMGSPSPSYGNSGVSGPSWLSKYQAKARQGAAEALGQMQQQAAAAAASTTASTAAAAGSAGAGHGVGAVSSVSAEASGSDVELSVASRSIAPGAATAAAAAAAGAGGDSDFEHSDFGADYAGVNTSGTAASGEVAYHMPIDTDTGYGSYGGGGYGPASVGGAPSGHYDDGDLDEL